MPLFPEESQIGIHFPQTRRGNEVIKDSKQGKGNRQQNGKKEYARAEKGWIDEREREIETDRE